MGRPQHVAYHSQGLILVRAQKATNAHKLPRWTQDTSRVAPQPRVSETVDQNDQKLNLKEDLSLGTTAVIQPTHLNSVVTWRPVGMTPSPSTTHTKKCIFQWDFNWSWNQYQFAQSTHRTKVFEIANSQSRTQTIILFLAYNVCDYCSTFFSLGAFLHMKEKNNCV